MGKHCIEEVQKHSPNRILKLYSSRKGEGEYRSASELSKLVGSDSHQGIVAEVKRREPLPLKTFLAEEHSFVLMCDSIADPHNFGAILRAAECFGVDAVVYSKNRNVALTPVVSKVSMGASELVPLIEVSNLADTLKKLQDGGFWAVAAEVKEGAQPLGQFTYPEKTVLILGAEGRGVQPLLSKRADMSVYIPMKGQIDSLNVSQATAVLLAARGQ